MNVEIATASQEDAKQIAQLTSELGYFANDEETENWLAQLTASPMHSVFIAIKDNCVCGWLVVEKRLFLESGLKAEITGLVVGHDYRRLGIAQALVEKAQEWAVNQGLEKIVVRSNIERKESHAFYPKVGFKKSKTTRVYVKDLSR